MFTWWSLRRGHGRYRDNTLIKGVSFVSNFTDPVDFFVLSFRVRYTFGSTEDKSSWVRVPLEHKEGLPRSEVRGPCVKTRDGDNSRGHKNDNYWVPPPSPTTQPFFVLLFRTTPWKRPFSPVDRRRSIRSVRTMDTKRAKGSRDHPSSTAVYVPRFCGITLLTITSR